MEGLLSLLKLVFLAALFLFLFRVVVVVLREMKPLQPVPEPGNAPAPVPAPPAGGVAVLDRGTVGLVFIEPAARAGELVPVLAELTVGRAPGCGIALPADTTISSLHARIAPAKKGVLVEDLGSTNGTFVNEQRITKPTTAKRGAQIQCGNAVFEVVT